MTQQIAFQTLENVKLLNAHEILYCQADKDCCLVYLKTNAHFVASERLGQIEKKLTAPKFFRCHKSYIINIQSIREYNHSKNLILLERGFEIPLAHRRKCKFMKLIKNLHIAIGGGVIVRFKLHERWQRRVAA